MKKAGKILWTAILLAAVLLWASDAYRIVFENHVITSQHAAIACALVALWLLTAAMNLWRKDRP